MGKEQTLTREEDTLCAAGRRGGSDFMLETPCSEPAPFFIYKLLLLNPNVTDCAFRALLLIF